LQISNIKSRTFSVPSTESIVTQANASANNTEKVSRVKLTDKERKRVEQLIRSAKTLAEITRLEKELNDGRIPGGVLADDAMEE